MIYEASGLPGEGMTYEPLPLPAPAAPRQLRLLCLLGQPKLGSARWRHLPVHTLRRMPPRAMVVGKWSDDIFDAGLYLLEAHAVEPTAEVLARCERHRQTNALRAAARTVRTGGVIA